ncbi:Ig-like domain-containing protein [Yersinia hibernica]|nr:Ig-like domain-containing protein [Yersinia hibernica]
MRLVAINTLLMQLLLPISIAFTPLISLSVRADELDEIMTKMRSAKILVEPNTAAAPLYSEQPNDPIDKPAAPEKYQQSNPFIEKQEPSFLPQGNELPDLGSINQASDVSSANKFNITEDNVANTATQFWGVMGSDNSARAAESAVRGVSSGLASQAVSDWLNQVGHARVQLNSTGTANADILLPLVDSADSLLFGQLGVRYDGYRTTNNVGLGVRQFTDTWMFGLNSFYDYDLTGKNSRLGAGAEAWTDNLKLSANGYFRLTDWHQSVLSSMEDYNERPANGFDIRAAAYLPTYPQLGGSLMYEKYFGKGVALNSGNTNPDDLGDSPSAVTLGVNYTPIPLVTVDVAHKKGQNTANDLQVGLNFNYRFGVPWIDQINKDTVGIMRSLVGSRYDLVERNYNIVMQYEKQNLINLTLPATISAYALENVTLTGAASSKYGTDRVEWSAPVLISAGGSLTPQAMESAAVSLPAYQHQQNINSYQISAVAYDIRGNKSNTATTTLLVQESPQQIALNLVGSSASATADGAALVTYRASVVDTANGSNSPMAGMNVSFNTTLGDVLSPSAITDSQGRATVSVKSILAGGGHVHAVLDNGNRAQSAVAFVADESTAGILGEDLVVLQNNALANAVATNSVKATVKDANGNPVPNQYVSFGADNNATLSQSSGITGTDGSITVTLVNDTTGVTTVTAMLNGTSPQSVQVNFIPDSGTATIVSGALSVLSDNALADGRGRNSVKAMVTDARGNPVPNQVVNFVADNGANIAASGTTGSDGSVTMTLTNATAGVTRVTATVNSNSQVVDVNFVPDSGTATIVSGALTVTQDNALADGTATNSVKARVTDATGNAVPNQTVTFAANNNAVIAASGTTGPDGSVTMTLTNATAGVTRVTATVNSNSQAVDVNFVPDSGTATIVSGALTVTQDNALADGTATNSVKARVTDATGNAVPNQTVTFAANNNGVIAASGTTGPDGSVTMTLTNATAGVTRVTATVNSNSQAVDVNFVPDSGTATIVSGALTVTQDNALADGTATNSVKAIVTDATGNAVPNQSVTFAANNNGVIAASGTTGPDGSVTMTLTNATAGVTRVTATVNSNSQAVDVNFVPDSGTATIVSGALKVTQDNALADGTATNVVKAMVTDATGNAVPNQSVTFAANNNGVIAASGTTGPDGSVTMTLTNATAGVTRVTATVNSNSQAVDVSFTPDSGTATIVSGALTVTQDNALADGTATNVVKAMVTDATGNAVPNQSVTFAANNNGVIAASGTTGSDGSVTMTLTNATAGATRVTATVNSNSQAVDVNFVPDSGTATIVSGALTVTQDNALADGTATNVVKAIVTDATGNAVPNQSVTFAANNNGVIAASGTTGPDGSVTMTLTNATAGVTRVTATVNSNSQVVDVNFVPDSGTATIVSGALTVTQDNALADGTATNSVKARVTDATGNAVPNQTVTFAANNNAVIAASGTTGPDGSVTMTLTNATAGVTRVTATVNSNSQAVDVNFVPDSGTATNVVKAIVTDATGNAVPNQSVTFAANNNGVIAASGTTGPDGSVTMTLTNATAGVTRVTATVNSNSQVVDVNFVPDSGTATIVSGALTVTQDNALADGTATNSVKARVTDATGNAVPNQTVTFAANNNAVIAASGTTGPDGSVTMTLTNATAGVTRVTATVNSNSQAVDVNFVPDSGTATIVSGALTVTQDNALADGTATNSVKARVTDATGNAVPNQTVTFAANNNGVIAASGTTGPDGSVTMTLTNATAGVTRVTATVNSNSQAVDVNFVPDSGTATIVSGALTVTQDNALADGTATNVVKAMVTDATGNAVPNQTVTFAANNNGVITASGTTGPDGSVTMTLTNATAGVTRVTATVNSNSQAVDVNFIADESTATIVNGAFNIVDDGAVADGNATNSVKAIVTDALGNPVPNLRVNFNADNSGVIAASETTGTDGSVTMTLTNTKSGVTKVTATVHGTSQAVDTTFIADASTASVSLAAVTGNMPADSTAQNSVKAKVVDAYGNAVASQLVSFSASNSATIAASGTTDINGEVIMTVVNDKPGDSTVTATINSTSDTDIMTFIPVPFSVKFTLTM